MLAKTTAGKPFPQKMAVSGERRRRALSAKARFSSAKPRSYPNARAFSFFIFFSNR
jgi:hypothetical protein